MEGAREGGPLGERFSTHDSNFAVLGGAGCDIGSDLILRRDIKDIMSNNDLSNPEKNELVQVLMSRNARGKGNWRTEGTVDENCGPPNGGVGDVKSSPKSCASTFSSNLECKHYRKSCSRFQFSCCNIMDSCHRCHMERSIACSGHQKNGYDMNCPPRVVSICCDACNTRQEPSSHCRNLQCIHSVTPFSKRYCSICTVWTDGNITHCFKCGTCRIGDPDDLFHCDTCDACFFVRHKDKHKCVKRPMKEQFCPICLESIYLSQVSFTVGDVCMYVCTVNSPRPLNISL
jgi:hypothetical protein